MSWLKKHGWQGEVRALDKEERSTSFMFDPGTASTRALRSEHVGEDGKRGKRTSLRLIREDDLPGQVFIPSDGYDPNDPEDEPPDVLDLSIDEDTDSDEDDTEDDTADDEDTDSEPHLHEVATGWRAVLGFSVGERPTADAIKKRHRALLKKLRRAKPDGSHDDEPSLNDARDRALEEVAEGDCNKS